MNHHSFVEHVPAALRGFIDVASLGVALGTLFNHLPQIAALLSIIWTVLRFSDWLRHKWVMRRRKRP